ncbi:cupin domain-containing protein [Rhodopseudomonas sp. BR0M22]|uniref:cupin domain-containing protein n=1 Tax=Rhodopseudomonas sp. BR0M22 TaxID=2269369 RepID=UPI0013DEBC42|nr:cupin domain-containing protein [Rhodopseudomonas sp. BR0M22]NEW93854.1 cupin domain-containing protein [Rhodopseudomonas sp. BR0M22]
MAILLFEDGHQATGEDIARLAQTHRIVVEHHPVPEQLAPLLNRPLLDASAETEVLAAVPPRPAFPARDLIALHPDRSDYEQLATKFESWHRHGGDEIRHILDGAGIFGIVVDGRRADLHVGPGDFVVVPAGLEHNFRLTSARRIKAVRYLSDSVGWAAEFTGRAA